MPTKKTKVAIPAWLKSEPSASDWEIIRAHSYDYAEGVVDDGKDLDKAIRFVPGLLAILKAHDKKYDKVKPVHIKTTIRYIDLVRQEISNKINKILKEKNATKQKSASEKQDNEAHDDPDHDEEEVEYMEEDGESEQDEHASDMSVNDTDPVEDQAKDTSSKAKTPIKVQSKKINKKDSEACWMDVNKGKQEAWRKVAYLKKIIEGRQFELKGLQRKYEKKFANFVKLDPPTTPPPEEFNIENQPGNK